AARHPGIGPMLLLFIVTTIGTRGFVELFPGFADGVFHRGPQGLAMLIATVVMSLAVLAFTASSHFMMALPCVFIAGAAMTITGTGAQTLIQASVDARMRGRVMALYGMIFRAGPAVGAVVMGSLSEHFGMRWPLAVGAMVSCSVWVMARLKQRQIALWLEDGAPAAPPLLPAPIKPSA